MSFKLQLNEDAYEEYINAYEWYEIQQKGLGERFMQLVENKLYELTLHPEHYGIRDNFREAKVSKFPYMIVYDIYQKEKIIHVVAIYHAKRNPKKKNKRK